MDGDGDEEQGESAHHTSIHFLARIMVRVASSCTAAALLFAASAAGYEGTAPLIVRSSRPCVQPGLAGEVAIRR